MNTRRISAIVIASFLVVSPALAEGTCVKVPPGHLITKDWVKTYGNLPLCKPIPPGIAKKIADLKKPLTPPDRKAPELFAATVTNVTQTSATISWISDELSTSVVAYSTITPVLKAASLTRIASDMEYVTFHSVTLTGLSSDTTYYFRVYSRDRAGNQGKLLDHSFTTGGPDVTTPQIFAPTVTGITQTTATIMWLTDEDASGKVYYGTTTPLNTGAASTQTTFSGTLEMFHTMTLAGLAPGTTYYYILESADTRGNTGKVAEHSFTTLGPAGDTTAPTITGVNAATLATSARVGWSTNEPATSKIYYGTTTPLSIGGPTTLVASQNAFVTAHALSLNGLTANTRYFFIAESRDAASNSSFSSEASFVTSPQ